VAAIALLAGSAGAQAATGFPPIEAAKLTSPDASAGDFLGVSVGLSADTAVLGAEGRDTVLGLDTGAALVFVRSGAAWDQQAELTADDGAPGDHFGRASAISGDTVIVGAPDEDHDGLTDAGAAYVFVRTGATWTQQARLVPSNPAANRHFGLSVSIDEDTAVVGRWIGAQSSDGLAVVFVRAGATWIEQGQLAPSNLFSSASDGRSVSVSGDTAIVGRVNGNFGEVYAFTRTGTAWAQQQQLVQPDNGFGDEFGASVHVAGDTAVVGAPGDGIDGMSDAGSVYVFTRSGATWTHHGKLVASDLAANDLFGASVSLSNGQLLVGAPQQDTPSFTGNVGSVYVFVKTTAGWMQHAQAFASDVQGQARLGAVVALSGHRALAGAALHDTEGAREVVDAGAAYVFDLGPAPSWTDLGFGLGGLLGLPVLAGLGDHEAGEPGVFLLENAHPNAAAVLFASLANTPTRFKGGTLIPVPIVLAIGLNTGPSTPMTLPFSWPAGVPAGLTFYVQVALQDLTAPQGVALSNALSSTPP